jgi:hypothetical protein
MGVVTCVFLFCHSLIFPLVDDKDFKQASLPDLKGFFLSETNSEETQESEWSDF